MSLQEIRNWKTLKGWGEYGLARGIGLCLARQVKTFLSIKQGVLDLKGRETQKKKMKKDLTLFILEHS